MKILKDFYFWLERKVGARGEKFKDESRDWVSFLKISGTLKVCDNHFNESSFNRFTEAPQGKKWRSIRDAIGTKVVYLGI